MEGIVGWRKGLRLERGRRVRRGQRQMVRHSGFLRLAAKKDLQNACQGIPFEIPRLFRMPGLRGFQAEGYLLFWKWKSFTLPDLYALPVDDLLSKISRVPLSGNPKNDLPIENIKSRLGYLQSVGLGYLTLDRSARSLSGGETQRVNLTACLGSSLTDTLLRSMSQPSAFTVKTSKSS